jgi:hypothetical protein
MTKETLWGFIHRDQRVITATKFKIGLISLQHSFVFLVQRTETILLMHCSSFDLSKADL